MATDMNTEDRLTITYGNLAIKYAQVTRSIANSSNPSIHKREAALLRHHLYENRIAWEKLNRQAMAAYTASMIESVTDICKMKGVAIDDVNVTQAMFEVFNET